MKIVDMGRAKPKGKGKDEPMAWSGEQEGPRVHVDHERMQKLGMSKPPATGDEYHIQGHARVVGSREEPQVSGDGQKGPVHSIEIVIHHMGAEPKGDGKSVRDDVRDAADTVEKRGPKPVTPDRKIVEKADK